MPKSYNKHYSKYREERQSKLPRRNLQRRYQSLVTGEWHDLKTRETWEKCSWRKSTWTGDREEDAFNLGREITERQIAELKAAIHSLTWISQCPIALPYKASRGSLPQEWYDARNENWKETVFGDAAIQRLLSPKSRSHAGYRAWNLDELRKVYCSRHLKDRGNERREFWIKVESEPTIKIGDGYREEYYLLDASSIESAISQLENLRASTRMRKQDSEYFFRATDLDESESYWKYSVEELSEKNPYRAFRLAFEQALESKRERLAELRGHLDRLQSEWDNYYSDVANLRAVQDERDKKYRQRAERRAEIESSRRVRQRRREQEEHAALVAEVQAEMEQWRENVHAGKDTCGCTSAPNSEGIRTLKVNYGTLEEATAAAKSALINNDLHLRPYRCEAKRKGRDGRHYKCGGFHLSSSI